MAFFKRAKVAVGKHGSILSTPVWTRVQPPGISSSLAIFGSGRFVVASTGTQILVSSNAFSWQPRSLPDLHEQANGGVAQSINALFHKNGTFLLGSRAADGLASRGRLLRSSDGENWSAVAEFPEQQMISGFGWGNGVFLASAYTVEWKGGASIQTYYLWSSANGVDWAGEPAQIRFSDLEHFNGAYYAANRVGIYRSTNLVEWTPVAAGDSRLSRLDDRLVAGSLHSRDGTVWTPNDFFPASWGAQPVRSLLQAGDTVLSIVGSSATVGSHRQDRQWEHEFAFPGSYAMDLAYGQRRFIVVSLAGEILASEELPLALSARAIGAGQIAITSSDTISLEKASSPDLRDWAPFGVVSEDASIVIDVEPGATLLLRGVQSP
jgi:hypothetical protein